MALNKPVNGPLQIDADGWCPQAQQLRSPNCDARGAGSVIDVLVIHNISLPPQQYGGPYIAQLFTNTLDFDADPYFDQLRALRVSSHFVIRRDGSLQQFVSTLQRAWHAGLSQLGDRSRCNDFSIGIELEGCDVEPFSDRQYACLCQLSHALHQVHPLYAVTGHQHIAPGRKTDPGPCFDWSRYHAQWSAGVPGDAATALPLFVTVEQKTQP
ncbi:1,6-anhydro-N-acetylmuramyl-L-alanine amidase AmpD [Actimicrobium sp. CCI2.3]|uniref:1,6-anhydro-N-acetylmuramyl-L-alanine amidase AmpD n=1 Tax=Actimicrobium sp. CCI2.3 TaxID=3048616 RepID=UPI002AB3CF0C|nr:1,6-anhydro-N-acetylmuramyl-L-alanine amidase AmpD [Actimicrobium sp. CCI2.3]MDY7573588.1 1,6-anhydro-N-acetylmuramyl-L-alanine amidase AmpD [Actimicrobium sp. CCI2.3]MEB0022102.1 1,6-anhydro-N-acetylmuramyl-L-alanine amidase AmpD [Actimicrobium sp. CCI2.3]